MPIKAFKIWYSDKTFDSTQAVAKDVFGAWKEAPQNDVQVVVFYFGETDGLGRPTRRMMSADDYYSMDELKNLYQSFDDITKVKGEVKFGRFTAWENIVRIEKEATDDYGEGWLWSKPPAPVDTIIKPEPI